MIYKTYGEIRDKVRKDTGLEQEEFVSTSEMLGYCNSAIDECEAEIHNIYADYFLTYALIDLVNGQSQYSLPSNIYANKIRSLVYADGVEVYKIPRYKMTSDLFEKLELDRITSSDDFRYLINNMSATDGMKIEFIPTPLKDETGNLKIYYIRNANHMVDSDSICDIPEFTDYIYQYMKVQCYNKEGHPNFVSAVALLEKMKELMINTLRNMTPDGDDILGADDSIYYEM